MTLTETAIFFKKYSKWALFGTIAVIILWLLISYAVATYQQLYPAQEVPTVQFGKLTKPAFPAGSSANLSFVLDTIDGNLPKLPTVLPVYPFGPRIPNLTDLDQAKTLAAGFGFTGGPQKASAEEYIFTDPTTTAQTLTVNIVDKNFNLATTNFQDPTISLTPPPDATDDLIAKARSILSNQNLLPTDLTKSNATVTYKKLSGSQLVDANSLSEANAARVDIFRDGVAGYDIVGPSKDEALVHLTLSAQSYNKKNILEIGYTYWPYYIDGSSTYPLEQVAAAWNDLKAGKGTLISPATASFSEVRIKNITIGYYQAATYQSYLQPIYIFDGEAVSSSNSTTDVRLYLPAVDPSYLN